MAPIPQKVLLILDDPAEAGAVRDALANSGDRPFQVDRVRRCAESVERLGQADRQITDDIAAVMVDQGYFFSPALAAAELAALLTDAGLRRGPDSVEDRERAAWNMQLVGSEVATHDDPT